jgi:hypothetical protein
VKNIFVIGLVAVGFFSLGLLSARFMHKQNALNDGMRLFYGPHSQFVRSAATVAQITSQRPTDAVKLNCRAMRTAIAALEQEAHPNHQQAQRQLDHFVKQGWCPK